MAFSEERPVKEAKGESAEEEPNWLELIPVELAARILNKLGIFEIFTNASLVCPFWLKVCKNPLTWRTIDLTNHSHHAGSKLLKFCLHAIERSCGSLEDISIEDFCTDEILQSIADSGSHLRRMRLLNCWEISDEQLSETVKKLPLLEEFEISFSPLSKDTLELMGKCCPHLKVLKFNMRGLKGFECDDEAFAIAKTMPQLCHLQLLGNRLTNNGLIAILDGCPHLESLDLRACSNVVLSGRLKERCLKQIKDLRLPEDVSEVPKYVDVEGCGCGCEDDHKGWHFLK
ncbi:putative F-box/LRR-repeat protein 23 isoform X3 [Lotus japonicus]|uniref:putative F-box/LRR-repeat protein 23 isoform X3 n=1 Tax=Lotus japonicus TaxID=34305 RepID=UPI0025879331|nr:putative F-box/LRR-repeat protein 23 isoform X3 [Lotus japonicus]